MQTVQMRHQAFRQVSGFKDLRRRREGGSGVTGTLAPEGEAQSVN